MTNINLKIFDTVYDCSNHDSKHVVNFYYSHKYSQNVYARNKINLMYVLQTYIVDNSTKLGATKNYSMFI